MTYSINVYDKTGKVTEKITLNKEKFADEKVNKTLIHEYYLLQQANSHYSVAHTKTRGEVAGSGKKLYRQKGTGNARVGDRRSPIRVGGGVAFGPRKEKNQSKDMTKKSRKIALNGIITLKAKNEDILALVDLDIKEPKTKNASDILSNIGLNSSKTLLVLNEKSDNVIKSFRNLPKIKYVLVDYLNPVDLLSYEKVLILKSALEKINQD